MTEKQYKRLSDEEIHNLLNELNEKNQKTKKVLQKYFDKYTRMAIELKNDKYGNGMCHDVTEVISEIADELNIKLDVMGFMK